MAVDNVIIHDTHINEWLTPTQILAMSSNIGAREDRARARRAAALRGVAPLRLRRTDRHPAAGRGVGRASPEAGARGCRSRQRPRRSVRASA